MQFVFVNDRMPRGRSTCAGCREQLGLGYLREMSSQRVFCSYQCYECHRKAVDWTIDRSGFVTRSMGLPMDAGELYVDWAAPIEIY